MNKKTFDEIYENLSNTSFDELEKERLRVHKLSITILIIGTIISLIILLTLGSFNVLPFAVTIIIAIIASKFTSNYKSIFKQTIIQKFIKEYDENLDYFPMSGIEKLTYARAGFERSFDIFKSDDLIKGEIDGNYISFAEVHTQREYRDKDGRTSTSTVFHGAFSAITLPKNTNTKITIHSDKGLLGKIFKGKNKIEMDSAEFEKYFDVNSENPIITMQILTSDIMNLIIDFKNKYGIKFEITIDKNMIYIRYYTGAIFEPTMSKYSLSKEYLRKYYDLITFSFDFAKLISSAINETEI